MASWGSRWAVPDMDRRISIPSPPEYVWLDRDLRLLSRPHSQTKKVERLSTAFRDLPLGNVTQNVPRDNLVLN